LAGDSSLDNKYWVRFQKEQALNGYEDVLDPPQMVPDIAYHLNREAHEQLGKKGEVVTINASVEESMLRDREPLLDQDRFIMNNISERDVLVVSVGGNDIALKPNSLTVMNILALLNLNSTESLEKTPDTCWGMNYFVNLFWTDVECYLNELTRLKKPKLVLVCMIYYPQERPGTSWANLALKLLGYDKDPAKLQLIIRQIFEKATKKINIPGTVVVPVPLFQVLDGKNPEDYVGRVEPSDLGGRKMSKLLWSSIQTELSKVGS
jgi:hypothetical protein